MHRLEHDVIVFLPLRQPIDVLAVPARPWMSWPGKSDRYWMRRRHLRPIEAGTTPAPVASRLQCTEVLVLCSAGIGPWISGRVSTIRMSAYHTQ